MDKIIVYFKFERKNLKWLDKKYLRIFFQDIFIILLKTFHLSTKINHVKSLDELMLDFEKSIVLYSNDWEIEKYMTKIKSNKLIHICPKL